MKIVKEILKNAHFLTMYDHNGFNFIFNVKNIVTILFKHFFGHF
jgi:hypothetical protein